MGDGYQFRGISGIKDSAIVAVKGEGLRQRGTELDQWFIKSNTYPIWNSPSDSAAFLFDFKSSVSEVYDNFLAPFKMSVGNNKRTTRAYIL